MEQNIQIEILDNNLNMSNGPDRRDGNLKEFSFSNVKLSHTDHIQQPNIEVLTYKRVLFLGILSFFCLIFGMVAIVGDGQASDVYLAQADTFSCTKKAYVSNGIIEYNHNFEHRDSIDGTKDQYWKEDGLNSDPNSF